MIRFTGSRWYTDANIGEIDKGRVTQREVRGQVRKVRRRLMEAIAAIRQVLETCLVSLDEVEWASEVGELDDGQGNGRIANGKWTGRDACSQHDGGCE